MIYTRDLTVSIGKQKIVENFTLEFLPGEIWGILGANGVGKTTLLHTLAGLHAPDNGAVWLGENKLQQLGAKQRARKIGLLAQQAEFSFPGTVFETAMLGRYPHSNSWFGNTDTDVAMTQQALVTMQLDRLAQREVETLSGGERQRLMIAALLAQDPEVYLLDEPTNHLDLPQKSQLLSLLAKLAHQQHKTVIMVLHDIHSLRTYCDKALLMDFNGYNSYGSSAQLLIPEQLQRIFPSKG